MYNGCGAWGGTALGAPGLDRPAQCGRSGSDASRSRGCHPDGEHLYVAAGTGSIVQLIGGPQPECLIAVDPAAENVI
jgi:hypothetical protein